jgi:choline dehydrogenase-like flavoprotein
MLSGIGDAKELATRKIPTVVDLPSVGKNLSVHVSTPIIFSVNSTDTFDDALRNETVRTALIARWNKTHDGIMANTQVQQTAYLRLPADSNILLENGDPAAGPNASHFSIEPQVIIPTQFIDAIN